MLPSLVGGSFLAAFLNFLVRKLFCFFLRSALSLLVLLLSFFFSFFPSLFLGFSEFCNLFSGYFSSHFFQKLLEAKVRVLFNEFTVLSFRFREKPGQLLNLKLFSFHFSVLELLDVFGVYLIHFSVLFDQLSNSQVTVFFFKFCELGWFSTIDLGKDFCSFFWFIFMVLCLNLFGGDFIFFGILLDELTHFQFSVFLFKLNIVFRGFSVNLWQDKASFSWLGFFCFSFFFGNLDFPFLLFRLRIFSVAAFSSAWLRCFLVKLGFVVVCDDWLHF